MSSITNLISVGVNGTGTANSVMKWLDADTATDSIIYDNGTNIGIGTSSPASAGSGRSVLHLNGASGTGITFSKTGQANSYIYTAETDHEALAYYVDGEHLFYTTGSERMRIDSSGNVAVGTSTALLPDSGRGNITINGSVTSILTLGVNGSMVSYLYTDANNSTLHSQGNLKFSAGGSERMRITSGGSLFVARNVNWDFPSANTSGFGVDPSGYMFASRSGGGVGYFKRFTNDGEVLTFYRDTAQVGTITVTTSSTAYNTSSDYRLKENVVEMTGALDRVDALKPSRFNFIADPEKTVDGFLAHEVQAIVPEAVTGEKDAVDEEGNPEYQAIDQSKLVPLLVGAIKELRAEIETLKSQING